MARRMASSDKKHKRCGKTEVPTYQLIRDLHGDKMSEVTKGLAALSAALSDHKVSQSAALTTAINAAEQRQTAALSDLKVGQSAALTTAINAAEQCQSADILGLNTRLDQLSEQVASLTIKTASLTIAMCAGAATLAAWLGVGLQIHVASTTVPLL